MQGVIKSYDPGTQIGIVVRDSDLREVDLASGALIGSVFRMLRPGQRVIFDLDDEGCATHLRLGSEVDMTSPGFESEYSTESSRRDGDERGRQAGHDTGSD